MSKTIEKLITPDGKTLYNVFNSHNAYYIDIYQRDYKWTPENVDTLLNDIEVRFETGIRTKTEPSDIQKEVIEKFEPYFLNTFLTNKTATETYIVDGQQRLTTFLIILIRLYLSVKEKKETDPTVKIFDPEYLRSLIYEKDPFGGYKRFKIYNENREEAFKAIIEKEHLYFNSKDETQVRIIENFGVVSSRLNNYLYNDDGLDVVKFNYYVSYLLFMLNIVEVEITKSSNVAMIFEVVNDRGLGLKPFEILKGKLLGILEGKKKDKANDVWTEMLNKYFKAKIDVDDFFKIFLRAKFANSASEYDSYERKYHYQIYKNKYIREYFGNFGDPERLYKIVTEDLKYFSDLYLELRTSNEYEYINYNRLVEQNQQYLLLLSHIKYNDPQKKEKIEVVSKKFEQFHTTLKLLDEYDSNEFQKLVYSLNKDIREKPISDINSYFDNLLIQTLEDSGKIETGKYNVIGDLFEYDRFKLLKNRNTNFSKYILLRVEIALSRLLGGKPSYVTSYLHDLEYIFNRAGRRMYALHLEHMYAWNEANQKLFLNELGEFDYNQYSELRERMGAVLLLKDSHNLSSNNDIYKDKLEVYKQSNIIWNEFLAGHVPEIDMSKLPDHFEFSVFAPDENGLLPLEAIDIRQKELFAVMKHIWADSF